MSGKGFHDDCMDLINTFCNRGTTDFQQFCEDWKQTGFHYVFYGHTYQHELLLYSENCFVIIKNIFTGSTALSERLAILYLMYAMYFKQPTKDFCKFRFTLADWRKMKNFYDLINIESKYLQARTIFWRLWQGNAFRFVEFDKEHYPETMQLHRVVNDDVGDFQKINSTMLSSVRELQNENKGLLSAIETLQLGYNEMKEHFASTITECRHLQSINVVNDVDSQLDKIKKLFESTYPKRDSWRAKRERASRAGQSTAIRDSETEDGSELNASCSSVSESNDGQDSMSEISDHDQCLNIGSKRYYLKRKALGNEVGDLHQFKSCVTAGKSQKKKQKTDEKRIEIEAEAHSSQSSSAMSLLTDQGQISNNDECGFIVINPSKKVYKRKTTQNKSAIRKQFSECPSELIVEIDNTPKANNPRKRGKPK